MAQIRKMTARELKAAYAAGERDFREIEVLRESLYRGANLRGANLYGANLYGANLEGANLRGADLYGANLRGADLEGANLYGADLRGANLEGANLYGANLYGANLRGADLYGANLRGANLEGANLRGADLYGADLRGADLRGAKHFISARIPGMSSRGDSYLFTGTFTKEKLIVYAGCFEGTLDEFRAKVARSHGDNIHAQLYLAQLAVFELSWKQWLTTLPVETPALVTAESEASDK